MTASHKRRLFKNPFRGPVGPAGPVGPTGRAGAPGRGVPNVKLEWVPVSVHPTLPGGASYPKPSRGHGQDAGLDLPTLRRVPIPAGSSAVIHTGWSIAGGLPAGTIGIVADRSGHAANHGITVLGGVIDPGYMGEIKVVLFNSGNSSVVFNPGDRVAQLLIVYGLTGEETTERGGQGFGSTGTGRVRPAPVPERPRRLRKGDQYTAAEVLEAYRPDQVLQDADGDHWTHVSDGWLMADSASKVTQARDGAGTNLAGVGQFDTLPERYGPYTLVANPTPAHLEGDPASLEAERRDTAVDMVNHPPHYSSHPVFPGEAWDYSRHMSFSAGNAFKYLWRCMEKGDPIENLAKAEWYVTRANADDWGTPTLDPQAVRELHAALRDYVNRDPLLTAYYKKLDTEGGLDRYNPATERLAGTTYRRVVAAEAYTAAVFIASGVEVASVGARARARKAINRAQKLARLHGHGVTS